jgi:predicted dehydrogenase
MKEAINDPDTDTVIIGLPNDLHKEAVLLAAEAGKAILCTKPLGRNAEEGKIMVDAVEKAGIFNAYLEDLVYTPKTLKSLESVQNGAIGKVLWVRSRETHPGPHSAWFWDIEKAGGGAIIDMGCHCVEIIRNFVGKNIKPLEVMCWADTLVHKIDAEDHGIALIRFANGAMGQFEVSWAFRGGMDLRDEVSGTEGTIWLDHFLRTGFEMFTNIGSQGYVAEKAEGDTGWLFPVGDEVNELGYTHMFIDVFNALDNNADPMESFYDGYVVNAIIDACYKSAKSKLWEPVELEIWKGQDASLVSEELETESGENLVLIKEETMPDGRIKLILRDKTTGNITEKIKEGD